MGYDPREDALLRERHRARLELLRRTSPRFAKPAIPILCPRCKRRTRISHFDQESKRYVCE